MARQCQRLLSPIASGGTPFYSKGRHTTALTRALAHLAALAPQAAHALLAPLGAHAALDPEEEGQGVGLLDARVGEAPGVQLHASVVEAHEGSREVLLAFHRGLDGSHGGGGGHLQGEAGPAEGFHENLHVRLWMLKA